MFSLAEFKPKLLLSRPEIYYKSARSLTNQIKGFQPRTPPICCTLMGSGKMYRGNERNVRILNIGLMAHPGSGGPWEWQTLGMADPRSGGLWEWRTLVPLNGGASIAEQFCAVQTIVFPNFLHFLQMRSSF